MNSAVDARGFADEPKLRRCSCCCCSCCCCSCCLDGSVPWRCSCVLTTTPCVSLVLSLASPQRLVVVPFDPSSVISLAANPPSVHARSLGRACSKEPRRCASSRARTKNSNCSSSRPSDGHHGRIQRGCHQAAGAYERTMEDVYMPLVARPSRQEDERRSSMSSATPPTDRLTPTHPHPLARSNTK